ncbi:MAG TPA: HAD hydrolase-like protein [Candidatus Saccharimonadia bacterium]|nr:HAD hydrolase-like protein [Candidatus Saccharimonadia bacterium]
MLEIKAQSVVWDFDGTILDSFRIQKDVLTEVLQRRGMTVPDHEVFVHNYHGRLHDSVGAIAGITGVLLDEIVKEFMQTEEHLYAEIEQLYFSDALDLMRRCHELGLPQIIVSNRRHCSDVWAGSPRNLANRRPLAGLVDRVVCADDNDAVWKPNARSLDEAERELGLDRTKSVIIGDQFVDAEFAHNLHARAVLVDRTPEGVPHLERLVDGWQDRVYIVEGLHSVSIARI